MKASPQLEDGHTRIANELLEALIAIRLPGEEFRIALAVIRKTYGFNKTMDRISMGQFEKMTGIPRERCRRVMKRLVGKNIITKDGSFWKPTYGPQKNYLLWKSDATPQEEGTPQVGGRVPPRRGVKVPPRRGDTKDSKDTLQKTSIDTEDKDPHHQTRIVIIEHLNSYAGTNYRPHAKGNRKHLDARLNDGLTVEEAFEIIEMKAEDWKGTDSEMYLRPETLFNETKCEQYRGQLPVWQRRKSESAYQDPDLED